jgi:hypothetical protein
MTVKILSGLLKIEIEKNHNFNKLNFNSNQLKKQTFVL